MKTYSDTFKPEHNDLEGTFVGDSAINTIECHFVVVDDKTFTPATPYTARCQKLSDIRTNLFIRKQAITRRANLMFWIAWAALTIALALLSLSGFSMEPYVVSSIVIMMLVTVVPERIIKKRIAKKEKQINRIGRKIGVLI